jgi:hypothetical protein
MELVCAGHSCNRRTIENANDVGACFLCVRAPSFAICPRASAEQEVPPAFSSDIMCYLFYADAV